MPRLDLDNEAIAYWNGTVKSEQPDEVQKNNPVDIFDLIFST